MENRQEHPDQYPMLLAEEAIYRCQDTDRKVDEEMVAAIRRMPVDVAVFFWELDFCTAYHWVAEKMRMKACVEGREMGGWDMRAEHWYYLREFVNGLDYDRDRDGYGERMMKKYGFACKDEREGRWVNEGANAFEKFKALWEMDI